MTNLLFFISLAAIWLMLLYHIFLGQGGYLLYRRYRAPIRQWEAKGQPLPKVSVLIPAHNESVVIGRTIQAMVRQHYPKDRLEVIVINDNSSDDTGAIADSYAAKYPFIKVVHLNTETAGRGKPGALNRGLAHATGDMIVVYDADNTPERMAVYYLALCLQNSPGAGAVVGKFRVINANQNLLTRFINLETITFQWLAQAGRWFWFGLTTIPGTNFIIHRHLLEKLGGWDERALAEDTELTIRVYNEGYYIRYFPAAVTWEQEPAHLRVWWKQRLRWARGNLHVVLRSLFQLPSLRSKRIVLDIFYLFSTYCLFFMGVVLSNVLFVTNLIWDLQLPYGTVTLVLWMLAYFLFISQVMFTLSLEKAQLTLSNLLVLMLMYFTYSQLWVALVAYSTAVEIKRIVLRQDVKWYKTERQRLSTKIKTSP